MSSSSLAFNFLLLVPGLVAALFLVRSRLLKNDLWRATLTPLSSIIGSGFLIMAPLLASVVGSLAPVAVLGIVFLAYAIGHVIRFNIQHIEPRLADGKLYRGTREIEYLGNIVLVMAYVIAIAFYLSLLSSFLLDYVDLSVPILERSLATVIILFIAGVGCRKGLSGLERLESWSVTVQLSVISSLVVALAVFGLGFLSGKEIRFDYPERDVLAQLQILAGALLVVQGFETSRFLGNKYSPAVRVTSMRNAQIISGVLYVVSVILLMPVVQTMNLVHVKLSEIIEAMKPVGLFLPVMLMLAALMSQFSAAVADLGGGGGLLRENSNDRLSTKVGYASIAACAILLVWAVDLLEIIALASRAFAAYYFLQTLLAIVYNYKDSPPAARMTVFDEVLFVSLAVVLAYIIIFSIPAG